MIMKKVIIPNKITILGVVLALMMTLTACSNGNILTDGTFSNYDDADIPDVLEITVGTLGNTYFSTGITDADYNSVLGVTFNDTTETDYATLMEHYQSTSTGTDENGFLLFDWGKLQVMTDDNSISITAFIK